MKKTIATLFFFCFVLSVSAQNINNYKYIVIPESFEFTEGVNQYQLNSLTKFLFEKEGFKTLMDTEVKPSELKNNACLGLHAKVENNSGLFVTKLVLKLLDCNNQVVFETKEGRSRIKEYKAAYHEALRDAFTSVQELDYKFQEGAYSPQQTEELSEPAPVVQNKSAEPVEVKEKAELETEVQVAQKVESETVSLLDRKFKYSGKVYHLSETSQGIGLYQENSSEPIAILIETNGGKSYIYNSLTNQGVAYFDSDNNLVVEYFNKQENKKVTLTYEVQN